MAIKKPGRVLLHHIPLKFVHNKVAGGGRKGVDSQIPLVPFIDFLITLVVFLLQSFSASGELLAQRPGLTMPSARNAQTLEISPIISIDARVVMLDVTGSGGRRVEDTPTLAERPGTERIEALIQDLETAKRNWPITHRNEPFPGTVILQCDRGVDFRVVKKVMFSAAQAGYANVSFAVNHTGGS